MNSLAVTRNVPTRIWGAPQIDSHTRPGRRGKHNGCPPCSLTKRGPHPRLCSYKYPPHPHPLSLSLSALCLSLSFTGPLPSRQHIITDSLVCTPRGRRQMRPPQLSILPSLLMMIPLRLLLTIVTLVTMHPSFAHAFNFTTPIHQCANVTMTWGTGGIAPYEVLLVPVGHVTPEIRTIINYQNITPSASSSTLSFSFPLTFPAGSQFIAILSDSAYGAGSGGTSDILTVTPSPTNDTSCLDTKQVKPEFYFYLHPPTPSQCDPWEISWPQSIGALSPTGDDAISLWAVVPGQITFAVPLASNNAPDPTNPSLECSDWTVDLKEGTEVILVAGYEPGSTNGVRNGRGRGGSTDILTVGKSNSNSSKCLVNDPPHTTTFPTPNYVPPSATSSPASTPGGPNQAGGAAPAIRRGTSSSIFALSFTVAALCVTGFGVGVGLA